MFWLRRNWILLALSCSSGFTIGVSEWLVIKSHQPPVGVYIAAMGLVVAFMATRKEPAKWEKFLWIVLATALTVAEIRNLYRADAQQTKTFAQISANLDATRRGLDATLIGLEAAADNIKSAESGINTLYSETTGGDSYMYLELANISGPLGVDATATLKKGMMVGNTFYKFVGTYPLHNVYLSELGPLGWSSQIDYGTIFPKEVGRPRANPYVYFYPTGNSKQIFTFFISTSNGSYNQVVLVKKYGDNWLWASRFYRYGRKKAIRVWAAPGFPKHDLNADWDKLE